MSVWKQRLRPALLLVVLALGGCTVYTLRFPLFRIFSPGREAETPPLQGAWVQARSITSREKIDAVLRRAEAGGLNAIFVDVYLFGQTVYPSALTSQYERVEPGLDPLAYLVSQAHRRGLEVHAWFPMGRVSRGEASPFLAEHPDWALVGPDGDTVAWLNFTRPDVRQFIGDLMLETVEHYGVDGLHFDYTRYPGPEWGFDAYSAERFKEEHNLDLNQLRYADLPAYGWFEGNPLISLGAAQVLATFNDGSPAVTLNRYGEGEVVLLNWNASQRSVAVGSEILGRSLRRLLDEGGQVYVLRSEPTVQEYGAESLEKAMAWLEHLGWTPFEVTEADIPSLGADSVLVLPNVYLISPETAVGLADFVRGGGGMILIDGPTRSISLAAIQALTGLQSRGRYFKGWLLMTAVGEHPLIPNSPRSASLVIYREQDARWKEFRRQGVSALIKSVYERVKAKHPDVAVSVTITSDQTEAVERYLQDWPAWFEGGYIDFLAPRGYVREASDLEPVLAAWQPVMQASDQVVLGLRVYAEEEQSGTPKAPDQLLMEIEMARQAGSKGILLFDLDRMSDEQLSALAAGPFAKPALPADK